MKKLFTLLTGTFIHFQGMACVTCNKQIQETIFDSTFYPNLFTMLSAFVVLGLLVALLAFVSTRKHRIRLTANPAVPVLNPVPLSSAATVLGIGLGGFIDGIVLHQILQWHEMLSSKLPPDTLVNKSVNMFWDGIFHAFTLLVVFIGVMLLWQLLFRKDINRSGNLLAGGLLLGWGLFNIVEGMIDHHLLKLHNVREITGNVAAWNYGFLGISVLMIVAGFALTNKERKVG